MNRLGWIVFKIVESIQTRLIKGNSHQFLGFSHRFLNYLTGSQTAIVHDFIDITGALAVDLRSSVSDWLEQVDDDVGNPSFTLHTSYTGRPALGRNPADFALIEESVESIDVALARIARVVSLFAVRISLYPLRIVILSSAKWFCQ